MSRSQAHKENIANVNANANANANTTSSSSGLPERVEDTLAHLLIQFLPQTDGSAAGDAGKNREQLEQEADDRFYAAFERAVGILEGDGVGGASRDEEDVNGSGDLIKKKRQYF